MIKSIAAIIAVIAQLTAWLKTYVDKRNNRERDQRNDEINTDPAGEFADKFSGGVRERDADVLRDQASATADTNSPRRNRTD